MTTRYRTSGRQPQVRRDRARLRPVVRKDGVQSGTSLKVTVSEALTRDILSGLYRPGDLLVERRLAERFGVSKTPVREALMQLQQDGLVEVIPRAGYVVTKLSIQEVHNIFHLRGLLEAEAAALAAEHARPSDLDSLEGHLAELAALEFTEHAEQIDARRQEAIAAEYRALNHRFHAAIGQASNNKLLAAFIERLIMSMERVLSHDLLTPTTMRELGVEHQAIVQVIRERDPDRARRLMTEHVNRTSQRILKTL